MSLVKSTLTRGTQKNNMLYLAVDIRHNIGGSTIASVSGDNFGMLVASILVASRTSLSFRRKDTEFFFDDIEASVKIDLLHCKLQVKNKIDEEFTKSKTLWYVTPSTAYFEALRVAPT